LQEKLGKSCLHNAFEVLYKARKGRALRSERSYYEGGVSIVKSFFPKRLAAGLVGAMLFMTLSAGVVSADSEDPPEPQSGVEVIRARRRQLTRRPWKANTDPAKPDLF
jgi:hypothetical protein